jgi:hypothetical protein
VPLPVVCGDAALELQERGGQADQLHDDHIYEWHWHRGMRRWEPILGAELPNSDRSPVAKHMRPRVRLKNLLQLYRLPTSVRSVIANVGERNTVLG